MVFVVLVPLFFFPAADLHWRAFFLSFAYFTTERLLSSPKQATRSYRIPPSLFSLFSFSRSSKLF